MSMRNEMIRRWKERRAASGTTSLAETSATVTRPATGDESWKEEINHALPKIIEAAVVAAFSSDNFREAVASMVEPAFGRHHDKLNQLKLANLNLESTIQTRLDELPALLQPAIDHMTSIQLPSNDKEFDRLKAGQDGCLHLLELFGEKMGRLEQQLQNFDGRMKALEEKVVNADLRSAIRFGEISNEFQDRNATLNDRLWELEREVGGKVDSQQRKIVGLGEDLGKAIRKTQEKISALESVCSAPQDEGSASNGELLERIEKMGKSLLKIDAMESSLRRDLHGVSAQVSSLDMSSLDSYPRRLEAIERSLSNLKDEIGTQGTLASLDSKLLSANNARLDTVASNVTKLGFLLESVKEELSDDEVAQSHTQRLESLDAKIAGLIGDVGTVQKHVGSLDTSALTAHSAQLAGLATVTTLIRDHLKQVDTTPLSSHSDALSEIKANLAEVQETINGKLSSQAESFGIIESALNLIDTTPLSSHSNALSDLKATMGDLGKSIDGKLSSQAESFRIIDGKVSSLPKNAKIDSILSNLEATQAATSGGLETLSNTVGEILKIAGLIQDDLTSQSKNLTNTSQAFEAFQAQTPDALRSLSAKLDTILSQVDLGSDTLVTRLIHLSQEFDTLMSMANSQGPEIRTTLAKIISAIETSESTQAVATKSLSGSLDEALSEIQRSIQTMHGSIEEAQSSVQEMNSSTISEMRNKDASILAEVQKSNASHAEHAARFVEAEALLKEHAKALEDGFADLRTVSKESNSHLDLISTALQKVNHTNEEHGTALDEALDHHRSHTASLATITRHATQLVNGHEKLILLAETHSSAIASLQDSVPKSEEVATLRTQLEDISQTLGNHGVALEKANHTNSEHATALKETLDYHQSHATSLATIIEHATQLLNGDEKLIPLAETHLSAIAALQDSVPKKEDVANLRTHLEDISQTLGNQSIVLENVSRHEAIISLSKQISESRDIGLSNADKVQGELETLRSLLETNGSLEKDMMDLHSKVQERVTEVLEELRSNKALMEEHSSNARTEGTAILDGVLGLKTLAEDSKVLSGLEQVKALIQDAKNDAKTVDAAVQPQLKSIISNEEKSSASLITILNLLETLEKNSTTKSIMDSLASLRALINDIDVNLASMTPEILVGSKAIEHVLIAHSRTITEMNQHVQAVKDDPTTSSILSEIGMLKETAVGNAASLVAVNENLSSIVGKIKDSEEAISKTILDVQTAVSEQGVLSKADGDALSADIKRLETHLAASANDLQNDVKVIDVLVRANGEAISTSQSKLLDVYTGISRLGVDMTSIQTEHLPKLSQDVQAINLSKLNTASATTEKALNTISTAVDELAQLSKGLDTSLSSLDGKVAQANNITSTGFTDLQTSLQSIDTTLTKSRLSTTKTHGLLESQTTILDTINYPSTPRSPNPPNQQLRSTASSNPKLPFSNLSSPPSKLLSPPQPNQPAKLTHSSKLKVLCCKPSNPPSTPTIHSHPQHSPLSPQALKPSLQKYPPSPPQSA